MILYHKMVIVIALLHLFWPSLGLLTDSWNMSCGFAAAKIQFTSLLQTVMFSAPRQDLPIRATELALVLAAGNCGPVFDKHPELGATRS
jgi:hypothetical protein